ncbi:hypothetical protein FEK47_24425 [Escherichia sp. E3659]|uniref:hypothetical protein n=1 Tax=Escherichia sp. E3659 TaxID=2044462 RepID=UPI0010FD011B|nr:hypothetical protein [Escherichia sp. E3659]TLJ02675.1 hypothetical protein FEK47_24425 [Escherichia sp. E3659]
MPKVTGVRVNYYDFDMKKDMTNGSFPKTLFPGATFQMMVDNDVVYNNTVDWSVSSNAGDNTVAVNQDGVVSFSKDIDESCIGKTFVIFAKEKATGKYISAYVIKPLRFFKPHIETWDGFNSAWRWVEDEKGTFPARRDINNVPYNEIEIESYHDIKREVNSGLFQEWGFLLFSGWTNPLHGAIGDHESAIFSEENGEIYVSEVRSHNSRDLWDDTMTLYAQAVAFYGQSIVA